MYHNDRTHGTHRMKKK